MVKLTIHGSALPICGFYTVPQVSRVVSDTWTSSKKIELSINTILYYNRLLYLINHKPEDNYDLEFLFSR